MDLGGLIIDLCNTPGPSGFEDNVRERIREEITPFADEVRSDVMGNLVAIKRCGRPEAKMLMIDAHTDEVGLIVTGCEKGFLRFAALGGVDPRMLPGCEVRVLCEVPVLGVIDVMPPHALSPEEMDKALPIDELYIDVCMDEKMVKERIPLGTPVSYASETQHFGDGMICGKSLDDRSCCAIAIKTMEELSKLDLTCDVCCLFSAQEEVGLRGATTGVYGVNPDYAVAIDVTHASTPDAPKHKTLQMEGGPAICVGPNMTRSLTEKLIETSKELNMSYQIEVAPGRSGTDAWPIQISRCGVATALLSLPLRYMHSPVEVISIRDAQDIVRLLARFVEKAGEVL